MLGGGVETSHAEAEVFSAMPRGAPTVRLQINLGPTARLMCHTRRRPLELEGGATFRVDDRFRASWSLLT
jgi:hypothetical protein